MRFQALTTLRLLGLRYRTPRSNLQTVQGIIDSARMQLAARYASR